MLNYDLSRMKQRVTFGTYKTIDDDTLEGSHEEFVPVTTVWCGEYTNTQAQTYNNLGTHINVDLVLAIRHNVKINKNLTAKYQGQQYNIININSDDRLNAFDLVTLQIKNGYQDSY